MARRYDKGSFAKTSTKASLKNKHWRFLGMEIKEIIDLNTKKEITSNLLNGLPNWFALKNAIDDYVKGVEDTIFLGIFDNYHCNGFISLKKHFNNSFEIYVMAVKEKFHNKGIGTELLKAAEKKLLELGVIILQVKTLSHSRPDKFYDLTRNFYLKNEFIPLEEFPTLWDESNPCLQLVKCIK
jgi:GNAT superfamily N-acetyltransferase